MEEPAIRRAFLPQNVGAEGRSTEVGSGLSWIQKLHGANQIGRIHGEYDGAAETGAEKRAIVGFDDGDWESSRKAGDAADLPSIGEFLWAIQLVEWQCIRIAGDKVVGCVERRKSAAQPGIDGIVLLAIAGRIVERFAEGVANKQLGASASVFPVHLKRIVRRIAAGDEVRVVAKRNDVGAVYGRIAIWS